MGEASLSHRKGMAKYQGAEGMGSSLNARCLSDSRLGTVRTALDVKCRAKTLWHRGFAFLHKPHCGLIHIYTGGPKVLAVAGLLDHARTCVPSVHRCNWKLH